jgi:hypothetical protein
MDFGCGKEGMAGGKWTLVVGRWGWQEGKCTFGVGKGEEMLFGDSKDEKELRKCTLVSRRLGCGKGVMG